MKHYAVIPTHNRPDDLAELLDSIPPDVHVLVIDNASDPSITGEAGFRGDQFTRFLGRRIRVLRDEEQPPNLSRLWNLGLDWAARLHTEYCGLAEHSPDVTKLPPIGGYAVTVLNDDVVLPQEFFSRMGGELLDHEVDIAFPCSDGSTRCHVNKAKGAVGTRLRMTGFCFTVRGSSGLRADERLRWWCGDDDLEQQALQGGRGTVRVPFSVGSIVHKYPDQSTTGVLREQTSLDMATFVKKWGFRPW